jgi:hypothetical protein
MSIAAVGTRGYCERQEFERWAANEQRLRREMW